MSSIKFPQDPYKVALISAIFTFILIVIVGLFGFYLGKQQKIKESETMTTIRNAQARLLELGAQAKIAEPRFSLGPDNQPLPITDLDSNVYNWPGKIIKIEDSKIIFRSPYENSLTKGKDYMNITAYLTKNTNFFRLDLSKPLAKNEVITQRIVEIKKSSLKNGHEIIAQSEKDLNLKLEMEATAIYLVET